MAWPRLANRTLIRLIGPEPAPDRNLPFYVVDTSVGRATWGADVPFPRVLLIHGFLRRADGLAHWRERIPGLGFLYLPGHSGKPDFAEASVEVWLRGLREALDRFPEPPLIIAESLGAVIAMGLPYRALVAVEPLLSTDQLWPLRLTFEAGRALGADVGLAREGLFAKPFTWTLEQISAPTLVIAGAEPLMPEREMAFAPSVLTDADFEAYARHPQVEAIRIPGGHNLLDREPDAVMAAARPFMVQHGYLPA